MAIDYIHASFISRSCGHNALAAAAYRANENLYCQQSGKTFDYENKTDCVHKTILLPESAYDESINGDHPFSDREKLWNAVEKIESSHNRRDTARLAMELKIALPKELSRTHQIELVESFVREKYVDPHGVAADICLHDTGDGNPHAHVMVTFRQVIGQELSKKKVRDIAPTMRQGKKGAYCLKDGLNNQWRDFQNSYFQSNQIDLQVDQNHIIPTVHQGHHRQGPKFHDKVQENQTIKEMNAELVETDCTVVIQTLEARQSVFTERDIQSLVFRMTASSTDDKAYQSLLDQVMASPSLVALGYAANGRLSYTTNHTYKRELDLADIAQTLDGAKASSINQRAVDRVTKADTLNLEQAKALKTITQSGQLVCVVGLAGTGKTHLMRSVKSVYDEKGVAVHGMALAGKASHTLLTDAGIQSDTIDRLLLLAKHDRHDALPQKGAVVVMDEAGMVGLDKFYDVMQLAKARHWKMVCVGDPDQLQPIARGAPFRAIIERVGFCALSDVVRQRSAGGSQATRDLAEGRTGLGIEHYAGQSSVMLDENSINRIALMKDYQKSVMDSPQSSIAIFAFRHSQVAELNQMAREVHKTMGDLKGGHSFRVNVAGHSVAREFAPGDRVMFLANHKLSSVDVKNGMTGSVQSVNASGVMKVKLDHGGNVTFSLKEYKEIDHAYAVTVHKSQGVTVDRSLVYASGRGWDRFMTYVALSRHRHSMKLYADRKTYGDIEGLKRSLSQAPLRDNVLDYPLQFAIRRGQDATILVANAVIKIKGFVDRTKDVWQQLFHAKAWAKKREMQETRLATQVKHQSAGRVAELSDAASIVSKSYQAFVAEHGNNWSKQEVAKAYFNQHIAPQFHHRNQLAHALLPDIEKFDEAMALNRLQPLKVKEWAKAHQCRERVIAFQKSEAVVVKGRLAMQILSDKSAHDGALQACQVNWKAVNLANWRYRQQDALSAKGQTASYETVGRYASLRRDVGKAWRRARSDYRGSGINPNKVRNQQRAKAYTSKLDSLAFEIQSKPKTYGEACKFYKVDMAGVSRCAKRHGAVRDAEHRKMAWEAFKELNHELVKDFVAADRKWREESDKQAKSSRYTEREESLGRLLHSEISPTLEGCNPTVMGRLRSQYYDRYLNSDQRKLFLHPEWDNLTKTGTEWNASFVKSATHGRAVILKSLYDDKAIKRLMEPLGRIFKRGMMVSGSQFKAATPGLYETVKEVMPKLSTSYGRQHKHAGVSRISEVNMMSLVKAIIDSPDWVNLEQPKNGVKDFMSTAKKGHALLVRHRGNAAEIDKLMKTMTSVFNRLIETDGHEFKRVAPHLYTLMSHNLPSMKKSYNMNDDHSARATRQWQR